MKKYTQEEAILAIHGDRDGLKELSVRTGISENTLRQYRRSARGMSSPVNLLFRLLLVAKQQGLMGNILEQLALQKGIEDFIDSVEDVSDESMIRARVHFKNGYQLSIIQGPYSYGGPEGLYEISPVNKAGELDGDLLDDEDQGDDVCGYCDVDKVNHYIRKIGGLAA